MILPILFVIAIQSVANPIPYRDDMPAAEIHMPDEQQPAPPAQEPDKQVAPEQDEPDEDSAAPSALLMAQNNIDSTPAVVTAKPPFRERHPRWTLFFKVIDKAISVGSGLAQLWYGTHK